MTEPIVGSLIYGDHKVPRRTRPWSERWKLPAAVGILFIVLSVLGYKFANYRAESAVTQFLAEVYGGRPEEAFRRWDIEGASYTKEDFINDWGKDGYYTKGVTNAAVFDSNSRGTAVVVYVDIPTFKLPLAIRVDKESLKLSYSPTNKYRARESQK